MPLLTHDSAVKEYWETVKDKYPELTFEEVELICKSPFKAIREWIRDMSLPLISVKYLGKFRVFPGKIRSLIKENEGCIKHGVITQERYETRKAFLDNYLVEIERLEADEPTDIELIDDTDE
jgi:hypothetical protein